jgi:hypothetical protein
MPKCWNCGKDIELNNFARLDACNHCGLDTHVCKNCIFYDPTYNNQCTETQADRVVEKEKSNFCDYFKPSGRAGGTAKGADALKSAADALFKSGTPIQASDAVTDPFKAAAEEMFNKK